MAAVSVCVAGGGSWGTALAHMLAASGHVVTLWLRNEEVAHAINTRRENPRYLPGLSLDKGVTATTDPVALHNDLLVLSVPCQQLRAWLRVYKKHFRHSLTVVNTAKWIETGSLAVCATIAQEELDGFALRYAALSGPSFAKEVLRSLPTAVVLATHDEASGRHLREIFSGATFRCYSSTDVVGVEMGGALKNVMAIAAGLCDGLELGLNSRAAMLTRGLAEMSRIGVACGALERTFMGLSGLGDLILSCTGDLSRNRQVGLRLGHGESLEDTTKNLGTVAEGVKTAAAVHKLTSRLRVDAPISAAVYHILYCGSCPREAAQSLMARTLRDE